MYKLKLLFILFLCISLPVLGQADVEICNNCSPSQKERVARLSTNFDTQAVIVVDMLNEIATKYDTYYTEGRYGEPVVSVYLSELSTDELFDLDLLYEYRKELVRVITRASEKSMLTYSQSAQHKISTAKQSSLNTDDNYALGKEIDVLGSPYDFLVKSYFRNDVYDFYFAGETSALTQILSQTMRTIKFPNMNKLEVYIRIQFYNDVSAEIPNGFISVTLNQATQSFKILGGRDGFNNSIPLNRNEISGQDFVFATGKGDGSSELERNEQAKFERYSGSLGGSGGGSSSCRVVETKVRGNNTIYTYQC